MLPEDERQLAASLDKAWGQLRACDGDRDLPDVICLDDVDIEWATFRNDLVWRVSAGQYSVSHVEVLDLPKDELNVRPLARLTLEDRLIYDACVLAMAPILDSVIPDNVYSYRWSKAKNALYSPKGRWVQMQNRGREFNGQNSELLLLRTDVTSFYEYVDIETLFSDLRKLKVPKWAVDTLEVFLTQFNHLSQAWGLPQGPDASGILANLYLLPVDMYLIREGLMHLRYSDDIMVFGPNWRKLRESLVRVNQILRARRLCLSASKTKIVPASNVAEAFEGTEKDAVRYNIDIGLRGSEDDLKSYFQEVTSNTPVSIRDLRFSLNQLRRLEDDEAVSWLLDNMSSLPQAAKEAIQYLRIFREFRPEIDVELAAMLANGHFNLYPTLERQVINYLVSEGIEDAKAIDACWAIVEDQGKGIVRDFAALYVGKFGGFGDGARLKELFEGEPNEEIKRALLISFYETGECPSSLLRFLSKGNTRLSVAARYLNSSPSYLRYPDLEVALSYRETSIRKNLTSSTRMLHTPHLPTTRHRRARVS